MKYPNSYIIFDIETSGLAPKKDKILEIGAIKVIDGKIIAKFNCFLDHGIEISERITQINSISNETIKEKGINPDKAFIAFAEFVSEHWTVIGHNIIRFDIPFFEGNSVEPLFGDLEFRALDTAAMFKALKTNMNMNEGESFNNFAKRVLNSKQHYGVKYSVDTCCIEFGIDKSKVKQHTAIGDCIITNEIYKHLCLKQNQKERNLNV